MFRLWFSCLIFCVAFRCSPVMAQKATVNEPSDLKVELRSETGSTQFQVGEVISLEVLLSSTTPNRYLEPCAMFRESNFGIPQCRFFTQWSIDIVPADGWIDLTKFWGPQRSGGPSFEIPSHDLGPEPAKFSYTLSDGFRIDKPGQYTVRLSFKIGLDDESTRRTANQPKPAQPNTVNVVRQIVLQIVPARPEWQKEIIRKGYEAYRAEAPRATNPPSPEMVQYQRATLALCYLGTPEAARVLSKLFADGRGRYRIDGCLERSPSTTAAIEEMRRLLVDPDVAVTPDFFTLLAKLMSRDDAKGQDFSIVYQSVLDSEGDALFAALDKKRDDAQITSMETVLQNPPRHKGTPYNFGYEVPFAPAVVAAAAANFDQLSDYSQELLLETGWDRIRSPLMLPVVRRKAQAGDGQALLRWLDLDPAAATTFMRVEVVRPVPRFSSFYLRLPEASLPDQERQIASNFIALTQPPDLVRSATLLHRYATRAVLPTVMPFIDSKLDGWSCLIQFPVVAYLLKVAPEDASPRVEQVLKGLGRGYCPAREFLTDMGFLQPSPVLERIAAEQIESDTRSTLDGIEYLRLYGSATAKQVIWNELVRRQRKMLSSGGEKPFTYPTATKEDRHQSEAITALVDAYAKGQGWVLSPEDSSAMQALLGKNRVAQLACNFSCGSQISVGPNPDTYHIYSQVNDPVWPKESRVDYLTPEERLHYSVNQYRCADMKSLKEKLEQFPLGSTFDFAYDFSARDQKELVEISDFLWSHGYKVRNPQKWSFLQSDSHP
jgi:hypothetical protein